MSGTLLTDDAEQMYADRLAQHAQSVWNTIQQAPQQVADAAQPALQAVSGATQGWQPIMPSIPMPQAPQVPTPQMPQIDPQAVADAQQALLQHAQGVWSQVQQAPQQVQQAAPDPSAVADATDRLQQHATNTWQTIGQGLSGATPAPVQQATNPTAPDQTTTPQTSPAQTSSTDQTGTNAPAPDRSMSFQDYAKAAAQRAGIDPNVFTAQIQQESGFNPSARSPAGAIGIAQFMPATAAGVNLDPTDPYASLDAAATEDAKRLQQYQGDWGKTLASYNAGAGAVAQYGGIPPYKETQTYVSTIMGNAQKAAQAAGATISGTVQAGQQAVSNAASSATQNVQQAASNVLPAISQFGDKQLTAAEAYAACGPAAAVRFAQLYGRNPTLREATDLASSVGWTADTGMAGLQSESKLFDAMQIPHRVVSADWNALAKDAQSGNPVTISTPGHYFTADNYNPSTGAFHVGSSGTDLRQGSEWMTPQQMESVMGPLQGGLVADNPNTPGTSPISAPATAAGNAASAVGTAASTAVTAAQQGWNAITPGLQSLDSAVQDAASTAGQAVGGAASTVGTAAQNVAQGAQQAVNAAGQTITDLGTNAGGAIDTARTGVQQAADTAGRGLPDITGTLTPDAVPGGASSPLGKIAQGQKVTPPEQIEAAGQTALGYEQSRGQAAAGIDPLRNLPGGNVIGPTVEQLTDPATWVGVGGVKSAIGVAASVAASVAAQQVAQNVIPDDDPNKGVKVALVSLLGAFTGGPVGERTIAPLVDRADTLVQSLGVDGVSNLVKQATDAAGDKVAPAIKQFANEELGTVGAPADVAAARTAQAGFTAPATAEEDTTRMYHGTGSDFARPTGDRFDPNGLFGPGYYVTSSPEVAGGLVSRGQFGINPETGLTSTYNRATGKFETYMTDVGKVLQPGYAQQRTQLDEPALQDLLGRVADDMHDSRGYFGAGAQEEVRKLIGNEGYRANYTPQQKFESLISALTNDVPNPQKYLTELAPDIMGQGGNVRAVDVPQNLKLLDADAPVPSGLVERIQGFLDEHNPLGADEFVPDADKPLGQLTGADLYRQLERASGEPYTDRDYANSVLAQLGYDGITYQGGQRIPMVDATGAAIEHTAHVIFPESLDKLRNAVSGTQGGQIAAPFAARLGGAAAGGAVGYQTTPDDASPQERALRTGAGAVAGYAGVAAASKAASALSDLMKPGLAAPQLEQAIKTVNETTASAPEIIDQVQKMPGTAELAPVRQQVPQNSTDLLQAMLDAARAKGADPDKLAALEQQITQMDPNAATRRGLGDFLSSESGTLTLPPGTVRAVGRAAQAARIGALAGGVQTLGHIALNTPVQIGLKMASDLGANLRYPEANAAEAYGAMQGLRHWGMNAASTLAKPGPLASSMGGGAGAQALETGLTGLVKAHPLLQDIPRQMATQMELYRTAAQAATDAGLPRLGAAWRAEVARLVASPTADMTSAAKSAGDTAALAGPMGTTGQAVSKLIKDSPVARFAVPIFDIGYRVASQGAEMTPLGTAGILADVGRAAIGEGPYAGAKGFAGRGASDAVTPLAQRVRNNVIGLALMYEGYQQAAQGNITGEGPADPGKQAALRETGWQPDSVKVGGRYFNAHLLGALGWPLIAGANTFESMNGPGGQGLQAMKTPEGERAPGALDMLGDYVARQGRYFNNETFLNSLGSALNLIGSGMQQGQVPANEAANVLQSLIPQGALLANLASSQDPYQRNPKAGATPIEDIQNQLASRLPDNPWTPSRSQLQPRLTATGTPMPNPQQGLGVVLPRSSVGNPDPILDEMQHTGVVPTNVPTTVPYGPTGEVQMTPGEQYTWQQYRGSALQQLAGDLINSPGYKNADLTTQRNLLARVNSAASAEASRFIERDIVTSPGGALTRRMSTGKQAPVQSYEPAG